LGWETVFGTRVPGYKTVTMAFSCLYPNVTPNERLFENSEVIESAFGRPEQFEGNDAISCLTGLFFSFCFHEGCGVTSTVPSGEEFIGRFTDG
jgi:hypothetical protein